MKRALLFLLLMMFGSVMFGKQIRHSGKHTRHSRKRIHRARRSSVKKPVLAINPQVQLGPDTRDLALQQYFQACACPAARWTRTFVREADRQGLDWRLVASIAMIESTGGKRYKNHNILGWRSAAARFRSEQAGIRYVSSRLGRSRLYTGKTVVQMLRTYNSERRNYVALVSGVMQKLTTIEDRLKTQQASLRPAPFSSFHPEWRSVVMQPVFSN